MARAAVEREVGGDLADHRRELETVTREAAAENHAGMRRMTIDHEMAVGRESVRADLRAERNVAAAPGIHSSIAAAIGAMSRARIDLAVEFVRRSEFAVGVEGGFHPVAEIRKAVERRGKVRALEQERRKPAGARRPPKLA